MSPSAEPLLTAEELYQAHRRRINVNTDRLFGALLALQFVAGIIVAYVLSPRTYQGVDSAIHPHVWAAIGLGTLISLPPIALVLLCPGRSVTRYTISVCQALSSGLLIHVSGGRIETHFHVFGSLAFLAFYRDWRVLIPATAVTAIDHFVRGVYFPQSVFGVLHAADWRWLEHAGWVIFEDIFLIGSCVAMTREMRNNAARTAESFRKNRVLEAMRETAIDCVIGMDHEGRITEFNAAAEQTFGRRREEVIGRLLTETIVPERFREAHTEGILRFLRTGDVRVLNKRIEVPAFRADGTEFPVELAITAVRVDGPIMYVAYLRDITDRKTFEAQAKHAEMLSLVASRTDNAVIITDPEGRIEWVNEGFTRVTGYELAEVVGRKPGTFLQGPDTDPETTERIREHLKRGEGCTAEIVNYAKNGRRYWLAMEVQPVRNSDGTLRHFMAIESDITARKTMEEDLRSSRERFEVAVRGSSDGLWDWNVRTGDVYYSPAFHEQLGYVDGELAPTLDTFQSHVHPDDAEMVRQAIADAHARRLEVYRIEFRMRHKAGHYVWILSRGVTLHDERGRAIRMAGSHTDITEQRQAAEAVRAAEENYRGLFENSVQGIFQSTSDGRYLSVNPAMARICGYDSPAQLVSEVNDIGRQHYVDPQRRQEFVETLNREGTVSGFEAEICRADGTHRWISIKARAVRDGHGAPKYYEGTVEDITDAKAAQAALRQAKEEAEQAREAAEAASIAKSQFLANMSHEIRTPLNGVIGIAELLIRKGGLSEQQLRYANVIKSSGDSLLSLINDILDFSKIEAGKLELCPIEFDLRSAVEDVVEMLSPKAEAKSLVLACHVSRAMPMRMIGDPDRVRQNLINLVNNAIKFTEAGHVLIRASVEADESSEVLVRFTVQDSGVGIPKDRLDRLFRSFSQVDASTTRRYGGTGLGLAIVKQLTQLMGGEVGVESTPGDGSSFWFTVRLQKANDPIEPTPRSGLLAALKGLRILVVDDQPTYLEVIREQLALWGVEADTSGSAEGALRKLHAAAHAGQPYRIALVDLVMPEIDGAELVRRAKSDPKLGGTEYLLMTAMENAIGDRAVRELGLSSYLAKPIRHSTLFDTLANVLMRSTPTPLPVSHPTTTLSPASDLRAHILLAEDNEVNQEVAREIITDAGCTVEVVSNGAAALAACLDPNKRFDLVLMDCQMPEMDGFEATKRIRAARGVTMPIIALTANAIAGDRERCLEAGMTDYVSKPVDPEVLLETMRRLLPHAGVQPHVTREPPASPAQLAPSITATASDAAAEAASPIDRDALMRRCRGKNELADRLLNLFASSVDQQMADLQRSLGSSDWEGFTRIAHTIKGSGANLSAIAVSRFAAVAEEAGRSHDTAAAAASLERLREEVTQCVAYIQATLAPSPGERV